MTDISERGLVLLGCGKMGGALLEGWLARDLDPAAVMVIDPKPSDWLRGTGVRLNEDLPDAPAVAMVAVKPQLMDDALPSLTGLGPDTLILSIAAGTPLARFEREFGTETPIVRAMPNTPAAIGKGITAIVGNEASGKSHLEVAERLLSAVGQVVRLYSEDQMDAVTAVSGSGPAYVFHLIETMTQAGMAEGLSEGLARQLATATVAGAGALADGSDDTAAQLRINVTSPNGTTEAALKALMDEETGFPPLLRRAIKAAADRSRELSQ